MTFQEFRQAVREIAAGRYFKVGVETTHYDDETTSVLWRAYVSYGWVEAVTPEAVLQQLRGATDADVAAIGEVA